MTSTGPVVAAGAVCWRMVGHRTRILVVHRAARADVSLPKGKVDPGETLPEAAVREVLEETGLVVALGVPLGTVDYALPGGRDKVVHYWAAEVDNHALELARFTPNDEIASLEWMPLSRARKKLSYPHDLAVLDRFETLVKAERISTFAVIAARHGRAVDPASWGGPDSTRPLMHQGNDQAASIAYGIGAYRPLKIISSTAARCLATVAPLARTLGLRIKASAKISQDSLEAGTDDVAAVVARRLKKQRTAVLCSHGPVLPLIVAAVAEQTGTPVDARFRRAASLATGEYTVLHISRAHPDSGIVAVETHSPA